MVIENSTLSSNKDRAVAFLNQVIAGDIENAYEVYVDLTGKHHNMYTPAGFVNLMKGMQAAEEKTPNKTFVIKHVFGDGDLVAIHSHLKQGEMNMATVHMFRFGNNKVVEMWDIAQTIPDEQVNTDGAF